MNAETKKLFESMHKECGGCNCGCPTDNMFEAQAAQFGYRATSVNATAMEQFQLQVAAQNALLLRMQGELTGANRPNPS